ncbi:MAG: GWxTD domain-containing protein [bacterium]|nr:GWxTD domain-containing protein [bacterium]
MELLTALLIQLFVIYPSFSYGSGDAVAKQETQINYFEEGIKFRDNGSWIRALDLWEEGKEKLAIEGKSDPRLGIAYVELVTNNNLSFYFEQASDMYFWSLSGNNLKDFQQEIEDEAYRVLPLVKEGEKDEWKVLMNSDPQALADKIRQFWVPNDPTPATVENERLLEHWVRICHSRRTFKRNDYSVYNCDDRGMIYVKYGEPVFKKSGNFGIKADELMRRAGDITDLFAQGLLGNEALQAASTQARVDAVQATLTEGAQAPEVRTGSAMTKTSVTPEGLAREIRLLDTHPEYELWSYLHDESEEPVYYLFGEREGSPYGLRNSVDEFIPSRYFGKTDEMIVTDAGSNQSIAVYPGSFLQILYYSELETLGSIFQERYNELNSLWNRVVTGGKPIEKAVIQSVRSKFISRSINDPIKKFGPQEHTEYENVLSPINILSNQIRMLDENDNPKLTTIAMSYYGGFLRDDLNDLIQGKDPAWIGRDEKKIKLSEGNLYSLLQEGDELHEKYRLRQTLIIYDETWNELDRIVDVPSGKYEHTSIFDLNYFDSSFNYVLTSEPFIEDMDPELEESLREKLNSGEKVYLGKKILDKVEPLETNREILEMSDLLTGIKLPENVDSSEFPFPVIPASQISKGDMLFAYVELYHLFMGTEGKAKYSIDYQIVRKNKIGLLGKLLFGQKGEETIAQQSIYESQSATAKEIIGFDISDLRTGDYEFLVEVTDITSGQKRVRTGSFKIIN